MFRLYCLLGLQFLQEGSSVPYTLLFERYFIAVLGSEDSKPSQVIDRRLKKYVRQEHLCRLVAPTCWDSGLKYV